MHTKLIPPGSNQPLIQLIQSKSNQLHIRKLVPIFLNWTNLYQDACVPMPNQSYTCVNLTRCSNSQPTLLTWPSSSSKRHIWATKRLYIQSTKLCPITLNSMTLQPTSNTVKEYLTIIHDIPQPNNLSQEDKILKQLCQNQSTWVKPISHTAQPIWVKPTVHKETCANLSQLYQYACVPVPNQSYTAIH